MESTLVRLVLTLVPMILSLTVHEYAHAAVAWRLGDDTASREGRMTLNPVSHIDLFGTLLLPAIAVLSGTNFLFGWAKPVPINPLRFTRKISMRGGMAVSAAAGPLANIVVAVLCTAALKFTMAAGGEAGWLMAVQLLLITLIQINVLLAVFNMIPLPPLDGSRVVTWLLPPREAALYNQIQSYSFFLLLLVLFVFGRQISAVVQWSTVALLGLFGIGMT